MINKIITYLIVFENLVNILYYITITYLDDYVNKEILTLNRQPTSTSVFISPDRRFMTWALSSLIFPTNSKTISFRIFSYHWNTWAPLEVLRFPQVKYTIGASWKAMRRVQHFHFYVLHEAGLSKIYDHVRDNFIINRRIWLVIVSMSIWAVVT